MRLLHKLASLRPVSFLWFTCGVWLSTSRVWLSAHIHSMKIKTAKISSEGSGGISAKICTIVNSCYTVLLFETTTQFSNCSTKCKQTTSLHGQLVISSEDLHSGICVRIRCARSYVVYMCA